jgi:large subunit ribosomal protein L10
MAKTRAKKESEVDRYIAGLRDAKSLVLADLGALKVNDTVELRRKSRQESVAVVSAKKTLLRRALKEAGLADVAERDIRGSVSLLIGSGDEVAPAKVLEEFRKTHENIAVLGGILEAKWMDAAQVAALAKLPSKEQLIAQVVGTIRAPLSGLVGVLQGNLRGLVNVLNAVKDAKTA